ncbi:hypothetical protein cgR_6040 [Corynebacterium glutamicum R]|uniref:Uncharacterized protein n=1 Tax=Corynebacterium glutamicum (strain R) TaxID=340322 RepID=A0AB72VF12_CORGB|nr:hypothetical protein cgR_6040 [Corynebacterium glutamicum R]
MIHPALLRTRGGISTIATHLLKHHISSPHTRRYFRRYLGFLGQGLLFSAHAEVFPLYSKLDQMATALLRTRGGISSGRYSPGDDSRSSPHTRRYFRGTLSPSWSAILFSAHAEVFPDDLTQLGMSHSLLRTRGGISQGWCNG